jgi:CheY-like chemotaxis protein
MLSNAGYQVICAASGQEAIGIVKRQEFDLVLMDVVWRS